MDRRKVRDLRTRGACIAKEKRSRLGKQAGKASSTRKEMIPAWAF